MHLQILDECTESMMELGRLLFNRTEGRRTVGHEIVGEMRGSEFVKYSGAGIGHTIEMPGSDRLDEVN